MKQQLADKNTFITNVQYDTKRSQMHMMSAIIVLSFVLLVQGISWVYRWVMLLNVSNHLIISILLLKWRGLNLHRKNGKTARKEPLAVWESFFSRVGPCSALHARNALCHSCVISKWTNSVWCASATIARISLNSNKLPLPNQSLKQKSYLKY